ncbi:permease prefix domain 1-containing protein [Cryptosporangium minutisporangium]|uniref:Uncharacterized protein n=1 Tax=Cryptosporangium minutisporangium TaxID=113569 RepID=A0ABP6T7A7_9ACTN
MTGLIDRYVFTAVRHVPEAQRADIDRELRASIDDAVDARIEAGEEREAAIDATLRELGDPRRLADRYADRPQYLIGPELYPIWRRVMLMLFTVVLPIVVVLSTVLQVFDDPSLGKVIGAAIGATLTVGAHLAFWTTGVFAILERTGVGRTDLAVGEWTPDDLPKYEPSFLTASQLVANVVWPVLLGAALVLQQFTLTDEPVLDPASWSFWWPYLLVVFALEVVYAVWVYRRGAWTHAVTAVNAVLALLFTVPVVWLLATDRFFNPEFLNETGSSSFNTDSWLTNIVILSVVLIGVWDIVEVALRAERARRGLATQVPGTGDDHRIGVA